MIILRYKNGDGKPFTLGTAIGSGLALRPSQPVALLRSIHTDSKSAPVSNGLSDLGYLGPDGGTAVETVFRSFKLLIGALILLPMLWMASCSMLGAGAVYAVKEAAAPVADAARREARRDAVRRHNEDMNRRAGFGPPREYDNDY